MLGGPIDGTVAVLAELRERACRSTRCRTGPPRRSRELARSTTSSAASTAPSSPASSASRSPSAHLRAPARDVRPRARASLLHRRPRANVEAARALGIEAAVFRGPGHSRRDLVAPACSAERSAWRRTVVFDLGGVLVDWDPRYLLREVMPGREAEMETILADVLNHEWNLARDAGDSWPDAVAAARGDYPRVGGGLRGVHGALAGDAGRLPRGDRRDPPRAPRAGRSPLRPQQLVGPDVPPRRGALRLARCFRASSSRAACAWSSRTRRSTATCWTRTGWSPRTSSSSTTTSPTSWPPASWASYAHHFHDATRRFAAPTSEGHGFLDPARRPDRRHDAWPL